MEARAIYAVRFMIAGPRARTVKARNVAAERTLGGDCTHLLFVDDDMVIPKGLLKLLLSHSVPIVGPLFWRSANPPEPLAYTLDRNAHPVTYFDYPRGGLFECPGGIGSGCMLISVDTLMAVEPPWFRVGDQGTGEDLDFCMRARRRGFRTYCDSSISIAQMGPATKVVAD